MVTSLPSFSLCLYLSLSLSLSLSHRMYLTHNLSIYHINSLILCVCVSAVFRCFHIEKSPSRPVSFAQWFSWVGGFLLSLILRLNSLWEVPQRAFRPSFSNPSHSRDRRFHLAGSAFDFGGLSAADRCRSFASVRKMTSEARIRREKQKSRSFCIQTVSFEPWRSRHFGLLSRPGPCRSERCPLFGVQPVLAAIVTTLQLGWWRVASLTFTRKCLLRASDIGCGNGFLFSRRPRAVSQSLQSALAWFQSPLAWFRLLHASDCRCGNGFLWPRPVSQSLQLALSWFQSALACFVCSVLRFADAGMAFSLAKDRDLSRCGMKCPSHWSHAVGRVRSFYQTLRECWMWKTPFCVVNSLQSHWRRGKTKNFFRGRLSAFRGRWKTPFWRRELASIALATRKTKNFCRGMLSAFRAGVSVVVGFHKPCCLVICSLQSPWLGVIFYPAYADHTDWLELQGMAPCATNSRW